MSPSLFLAAAPHPDAAPGFGAGTAGILFAGALCAVVAFALRRRLFDDAAIRRRADRAGQVQPLHWFLIGLAGWWTWAVAGSLLASGVPAARSPDHPLQGALVSLGAYAAGLAASGVLASLWLDRIRAAGLSAAWRDPLPAGVACLLGFPIILATGIVSFVAASAVAGLTGGPPPDRVAHESLRELLTPREGVSTALRVGALAFHAVVLAPVFEEIVYRLCLQSALVAAFRRSWLAIALSSAIFALVHAGSVPLHAMPVLFGVGALCGVLFERTGRIGPAILAHAAFNALNLAMALAGDPGPPGV